MRRPVAVKGILVSFCLPGLFLPARLPLSPCFHPYSRGAIRFARCMLGVLNSAGAAICLAILFICASSTSITWERTPHPVRRPAFSSHLIASAMGLAVFRYEEESYVEMRQHITVVLCLGIGLASSGLTLAQSSPGSAAGIGHAESAVPGLHDFDF